MALYSLTRRTDPVGALLGLQSEVGRAFEHPFGFRFGVSGRSAFPSVDLSSDSKGTILRMELPGVGPEDLEVEAEGRTLVIRGKREPADGEGGSFHRRERWSGEFSRSFAIPEQLDPDGAQASYEYGVLTVRIPKRAELQPRQIEISAA
ncbi:MAG: Hsp20/alpha crystallin family protein, partial [Myxococcales bacterium]|nr:Hsp20/alpha crystallin family protein [Myxococcales bacterium]